MFRIETAVTDTTDTQVKHTLSCQSHSATVSVVNKCSMCKKKGSLCNWNETQLVNRTFLRHLQKVGEDLQQTLQVIVYVVIQEAWKREKSSLGSKKGEKQSPLLDAMSTAVLRHGQWANGSERESRLM